MSIADLARSCFHSGVAPQRWNELCQLMKDKNLMSREDFESNLSNSVLCLFNAYPADPTLLSYIRSSLHCGLLSLPSFLIAFLQAAKSPLLHDAATLDAICRLIKEEHYSSGLPALGGLLPYHESTHNIFAIAQDALSLLRTSHTVPSSSFPALSGSVDDVVLTILSCIRNMEEAPTAQAMLLFADILDILNTLRVTGDIRTLLEQFAFTLGGLLGDDARMTREAQMMQSLQYAFDKGDAAPLTASDSNIAVCSLVLRHLVAHRGSVFGSGNTTSAAALLVATFRGVQWPPAAFYSQLFLAAFNCLAQANAQQKSVLLWKSFIIARLPQLLLLFENVLGSEAVSHAEWRSASQAAITGLYNRPELLLQCESATRRDISSGQETEPVNSRSTTNKDVPFLSQLIQYYSSHTHLLDPSFAHLIEQNTSKPYVSPIALECESSMDVEAYIDFKLSADVNGEETLEFLQRALEDYSVHQALSNIFYKRFTNSCQMFDVDALSQICRLLYLRPNAMDIISLHIKLTDLVNCALAFIEDCDCESVGDPQTAVSHLGEVILFVQSTLAKYKLPRNHFVWNHRIIRPAYLLSTSTIFARQELTNEDAQAFATWFKALFDSGSDSEGIDDSILRATKPKTLLKLSASLISYAITACAEKHIDIDVLNNGVSYFTGSLLNWTLVGVIKALFDQILQMNFSSNLHLTILQTLVQSPSCPLPVLQLTGHGLLRLLSDPRAQTAGQNVAFDPAIMQVIAQRALGISAPSPAQQTLSMDTMGSQVSWVDLPRHLTRDAIGAARSGKPAWLDVDRCVAAIGPEKFLRVLWQEVSAAASIGDVESCRRIIVFALTSSSNISSRHPPLLPIFLHYVINILLPDIDQRLPTEQSILIDLLASVATSALTTVLHLEWALRALESDHRHPLGLPCATSARRLTRELRHSDCRSASLLLQRILSSTGFAANFPLLMV